ncbi:MAG: hypothetical protein AB7F28_05995 [Candidatus Margulisiibacteriota bacterium]
MSHFKILALPHHIQLLNWASTNQLSLDNTIQEVKTSLPASVQRAFTLSETNFEQAAKRWMDWIHRFHSTQDEAYKAHSKPKKPITFAYEAMPNDDRQRQKWIKDVCKYWAHTTLKWQVIGHADYMTGDTDEIRLALFRRKHWSVKLLKGPKNPPKPNSQAPKTPSISARCTTQTSEAEGAKRHALYYTKTIHNQVKTTDLSTKNQGTSAVAQARYADDIDPENLRRTTPKKPWNLHVTFATKAAGLRTKKVVNHAQKHMDLRLNMVPTATKTAIKNYFDAFQFPDQCIVLWGRTSGQNGGAHRELDSDPTAWINLIRYLRKTFPQRTIVLMGDPVPGLDVSRFKKVRSVNTFWRFEAGSLAEKALNACPDQRDQISLAVSKPLVQDYFVSLFKSKQAVMAGMRSGNLHRLAFLGIPTVYFDDVHCNPDAGPRLEQYTGNAGRTGKRLSQNRHLPALTDPHFLPYRRIETARQLGLTTPLATQLKSANQTLQTIRNNLHFLTSTHKDALRTLLTRIQKTAQRLTQNPYTMGTTVESLFPQNPGRKDLSHQLNQLSEAINSTQAQRKKLRTHRENPPIENHTQLKRAISWASTYLQRLGNQLGWQPIELETLHDFIK